jgi:uncharacterized protein
MFVSQTIQRAQGINVFGSCLIRVDPDYTSLRFSCTRTHATPKEAFSAVRSGARDVKAKLAALGVADRDVRESEIRMQQAYENGLNQTRKFVGYCATVSFHVILHDLRKTEDLLIGVVDAGADLISSVHPKTTRLRELRVDARRRAFESARAKALDYATAANCKLGQVLHIEDVNPEDMSRRSHAPDVDLSAHDEGTSVEAQNPGGIVVAGAVMACFAILPG